MNDDFLLGAITAGLLLGLGILILRQRPTGLLNTPKTTYNNLEEWDGSHIIGYKHHLTPFR